MTRQERRKRRRQRRRRMQAGILLSLVLVLGLIIALRAGKERETLEQEIPLAAERQTLAYIAPAPALPDTAAEETPEEPEEPPVEPEPENRYAELHFSDEDVYILACLVYHEARGESFEGQVAVVEVVLNRMLSDYFPDTVEEVVFQKYGDVWQFSPCFQSFIACETHCSRGKPDTSTLPSAVSFSNSLLPRSSEMRFASSP